MKEPSIDQMAFEWVVSDIPHTPSEHSFCATRDTFTVRLEGLLKKLETSIKDEAYLLTAVVGEIGNNSFDHNLGNWPDMPGVYFDFHQETKMIVLADRGQGVRKSLSKAKSDIANDEEALQIAFTQVLSGRTPERRGNGLKFVAQAINDQHMQLSFQSEHATATLIAGKNMEIHVSPMKIHGTLAILRY